MARYFLPVVGESAVVYRQDRSPDNLNNVRRLTTQAVDKPSLAHWCVMRCQFCILLDAVHQRSAERLDKVECATPLDLRGVLGNLGRMEG